MNPGRAAAILDFLAAADRLKRVERRGRVVLADGSTRRENSAEHSWNLALVAVLLHGEVAAPVDLARALTMAAVHDLVEIEAGETAEARFAMACDRLQGFLQNVLSGSLSWREHGVTRADTAPRMNRAMAVDPTFASLTARLYEQSEAGGMLGG